MDGREDLRSEAILQRVVVEQSRYVGVATLSSGAAELPRSTGRVAEPVIGARPGRAS
ncbi:hypothetical protein WME90_37195 [Sorangium sp. So ce375]|uniref:hypothetical protein n=1 Tax=Sorangium sp. So ce375 TaxID=3133306 RepID=UPI003F5CB6E5